MRVTDAARTWLRGTSRGPTWSPRCAGGAWPTSTTRRSPGRSTSDASLYRVVPQVVVRPRHADELDAVLDVASETGVPVTMRGAGTSIAGNAVGTGIVVDTVRHLEPGAGDRPEARTAVVQPGVVHADLQRAAAPARAAVRTGPVDAHPLHDRRDDRQQRVRLAGAGLRAHGRQRRRARRRARPGATEVEARLAALVDQHLAHVRTGFWPLLAPGQRLLLEHLLPENGRSLDRFLVGSEGTLALVRGRRCAWSTTSSSGSWWCLGYPRWWTPPTPYPP